MGRKRMYGKQKISIGSIYLRREQLNYLDKFADENGCHNPSQAISSMIDKFQKSEEKGSSSANFAEIKEKLMNHIKALESHIRGNKTTSASFMFEDPSEVGKK